MAVADKLLAEVCRRVALATGQTTEVRSYGHGQLGDPSDIAVVTLTSDRVDAETADWDRVTYGVTVTLFRPRGREPAPVDAPTWQSRRKAAIRACLAFREFGFARLDDAKLQTGPPIAAGEPSPLQNYTPQSDQGRFTVLYETREDRHWVPEPTEVTP